MALLGVKGREDRKAVRMTTISITTNGISHVHDLDAQECKGGSILAYFFQHPL